jgi:hypothetical protein
LRKKRRSNIFGWILEKFNEFSSMFGVVKIHDAMRAKFKCSSVETFEGGNQTAKLRP